MLERFESLIEERKRFLKLAVLDICASSGGGESAEGNFGALPNATRPCTTIPSGRSLTLQELCRQTTNQSKVSFECEGVQTVVFAVMNGLRTYVVDTTRTGAHSAFERAVCHSQRSHQPQPSRHLAVNNSESVR